MCPSIPNHPKLGPAGRGAIILAIILPLGYHPGHHPAHLAIILAIILADYAIILPGRMMGIQSSWS